MYPLLRINLQTALLLLLLPRALPDSSQVEDAAEVNFTLQAALYFKQNKI